MKFVIAVKRFYAAIQKPIACLCLFIAVLANVLGIAALQQAAILGIGFVALQVLFDIHSELLNRRGVEPLVFHSYSATFIEMEKIIASQAQRKKKISLKWLGTCMDIGWLFLNRYLIKVISNQSDISVEVEIVMLAPDWSDFDRVNLFWKSETQNRFNAITEFIAQHSSSNVKIKVKTYKHMPYYTGLFVNEKYLFLGLCQWDNGRYGVEDNSYTLYRKRWKS
jgi:hypothetical protein